VGAGWCELLGGEAGIYGFYAVGEVVNAAYLEQLLECYGSGLSMNTWRARALRDDWWLGDACPAAVMA